jgi:Gluconate 2-dehydrogenase subunit 3
MTEMSRRALIKAAGAIGAATLPAGAAIETANARVPAAAIPAATPSICATGAPSTTYVFFNSEEAAFIEAAVARLIPADEEWPGALEACAPNYIDKQLAGLCQLSRLLIDDVSATLPRAQAVSRMPSAITALRMCCQRRVAAETCWRMRDRQRRKFRSSSWPRQ